MIAGRGGPDVRPAGRRRGGTRSPLLASLLWTAAAACATGGAPGGGAVVFDSARVWIREGRDSVALLAEVARTYPQQARGLMDRESLESLSGMLFVFDAARSAGFWMWHTRMPLDVAFIDGTGVILSVLTMEPCDRRDAEACPEHTPGLEYRSALEVNAGWFERHGLGVGAAVRVEALPPPPPGS